MVFSKSSSRKTSSQKCSITLAQNFWYLPILLNKSRSLIDIPLLSLISSYFCSPQWRWPPYCSSNMPGTSRLRAFACAVASAWNNPVPHSLLGSFSYLLQILVQGVLSQWDLFWNACLEFCPKFQTGNIYSILLLILFHSVELNLMVLNLLICFVCDLPPSTGIYASWGHARVAVSFG